jgi:hypothetical protein
MRAPTVPAHLELQLWSATTPEEAAALAADPSVTGMLDEAFRILATAGIALDPSTVQQLEAPDADEFRVIDDDGELGDLLARLDAAGRPQIAAHAILVHRIAMGPGTTVVARSTGIPGAPAHPTLRRRSALVLALDSLPKADAAAGAVLAHELGHLLGLAHTSEANGEQHDAIADTPECLPEAAANVVDGIEPLLSAEDCADLDGTNLMFYTPSVTGLSQEMLTEGQRFVIDRSPLLH